MSTSLVPITNDLNGFNKSSWIVVAYLLTYTAFLIMWSKVSDICGRKRTLVLAVFIFCVFSAGCAASQTMIQLIVNRAFQGLGGSGAYALTVLIFWELYPETKYAMITSMVSLIFAISLLVGPLIGGAITTYTSWRWIFWINVPAAFITMIILVISLPDTDHNDPNYKVPSLRDLMSTEHLSRLDSIGIIALLVASLLLVTTLQLVGIEFNWSSAASICMLFFSGFLWVFFFGYEWSFRYRPKTSVEPVFPWRFFTNRAWMFMLLNTFLLGAPLSSAIIQIPLRLQIVYNISSLEAGIRFMPFAFSSPAGGIVFSMTTSKLRIPPIFVMFFGASCQCIGYGLLSTLPTTGEIWSAQYGFEVLAAFGTGGNMGLMLLMTPFLTEKKDRSVATGAIVQFRMLGGAIGLAVLASLIDNWITSQVASQLDPVALSNLLQSATTINTLPPDAQGPVRAVLAEGYNIQMKILLGFAVAEFFATCGMWTNKLLRVK